jgi:Cu-Zn family superoxide dismutase
MRMIGVISLVAALSACSSPAQDAPQVLGANAKLIDRNGAIIGQAWFVERDQANGVVIQIQAWGLPPGAHGCQIYALARCENPDFETAGNHFNPFGKKHGLKNPQGPHAGDLPNLMAGADGKVDVTFTTRLVTLHPGENSLLGPLGTSIVIHAEADDEKTDPGGNSGPRIACGVIRGPAPTPPAVQ